MLETPRGRLPEASVRWASFGHRCNHRLRVLRFRLRFLAASEHVEDGALEALEVDFAALVRVAEDACGARRSDLTAKGGLQVRGADEPVLVRIEDIERRKDGLGGGVE